MTTAQLFSRLLSHATVRDPGRVPFDESVEIVAGINAALGEYFSLAPARFSELTLSRVLPAPETRSVAAVNGSASVGTFLASHRGATVVIGDDPGQNEVTGTGSVLDAYLGTTGTVSAVVYGDGIVIANASYKRVVSDPRLNDGTQLRFDDGLLRGRFNGVRGTGKPVRYCVEMTGTAAGGEDVAILRVDPMPSRSYIVRMEISALPLLVTNATLSAPVAVPVPYDMDAHLIALCRWHLKGNKLFPDKKDTDEKADAARNAIAGLSPHAGRSHGKVGTPRGF
jgi:hypothetical protein